MAINEEVRFEIISHIGVLKTHETGWTRELNIVRWNGGIAKYDIRDWNDTHEYMSRGITFTREEGKILAGLLAEDLSR